MTIEHLKENLAKYFSTNFMYEKEKGIYEITTPFLDGHNDNIIVYLNEESNGNYKLSDGGYIRFETDSKNIPMFVGQTRFKIEDEEIYTLIKESDFPKAIIDMVTLIIIVTNQHIMSRLLWRKEAP